MSDSECLTIDEGTAHQILIAEVITTIAVGETFKDTRGLGMDKAEFDKLLPSLPREEHKAFQEWFIAYQDFTTWDEFKSKGYRHVMEVKDDIEKHILDVTGKPQQLKLAFMPTTIARTSPFFPMSKAEMKNRPLYQDFVIENRWGRITISGPRLSIYDESVLLTLLVLAKKHKSDHIQTSFSEMCETMGVARGANTYAAISASLKRFRQAVIDTELYKKDSEKKEVARLIGGAIVSSVDQETESGKIKVTLNPYFLALYGANLTTSLDVGERAKLKGDTTKALYRFIQTHKPGSVPFGLLTLCHGINLNTEQPLFEIRKQIRPALTELKKHGHIKSWKIDQVDNVYIKRN